jgi:hypothetical protein
MDEKDQCQPDRSKGDKIGRSPQTEGGYNSIGKAKAA